MSKELKLTTAAFLTLVLVIFTLTRLGPKPHKPTVTRGEYGIVEQVSSCHTSKYSYHCSIRTDLGNYYLEVSDFPEEAINIGDTLFVQYENNGRRIDTSLCKNNLCSDNSVCFWWMPCFSRKEAQMEEE